MATRKIKKKKKTRRVLTPAEKRAKVALHKATYYPRSAFRNDGTMMPSDQVVHKKHLASEVQDEQ